MEEPLGQKSASRKVAAAIEGMLLEMINAESRGISPGFPEHALYPLSNDRKVGGQLYWEIVFERTNFPRQRASLWFTTRRPRSERLVIPILEIAIHNKFIMKQHVNRMRPWDWSD